MVKPFKLIIIAVVGFLFSIAALEIDAYGFDNTFFDVYDSYFHADNHAFHKDNNLDHDYSVIFEITPIFFQSAILLPGPLESSIPSCHYKQKLYLIESSLLI